MSIIACCIAPGKVRKERTLHYLLQNWLDQHLTPAQIDFTVSFYDKTSNIDGVVVKLKDSEKYLVVTYNGEEVKQVHP